MRIRHLLALPALVFFTSCYQFEITAQGGFAQLALDGDIGYVTGTGGVSIQDDIESGLGLGDDQGTPYVRANMDFGVPNLSVSGFLFEDDGRGLLTQNFGGVAAGVPVLTDFEMASAKIAYTFEIPLGPVSLQPGLAVNLIDLSILVRDSIGIASEDIQLSAPLPMLFGRAEIDIADFLQLVGEVGYVAVDVEDVEANLLDVEALLELTALEPLNLFVGYRSISFEGEGEIDGDSIDIDLGLSGLIVGGGIRF
ncbi:MAG: hypothetical protein NXI31_04455 [bacterium]|nr:hypothetical protein [bacterium]